MKIGARVLKTGIAISLSLFLSIILLPSNSPALAGLAAVSATMPSMRSSVNTLTSRLMANTIGGVVAVAVYYTIGSNEVSIGIASIILISVLNMLKLTGVIKLSIMTLIIVMLESSDQIVMTAVYRVLETFIGVLVSFGINYLIYPPQYDDRFYESLTDITSELLIFIRASLRKNMDFSILQKDMIKLYAQFKEVKTLFELMRNELIFSKKRRQIVARKLVIYRHMVETLYSTYKLLDTLHKNDHVYNNFDRELQVMVRSRCEILLSAHEQVLLKFNGRVGVEDVTYMVPDDDFRSNYVEMFYAQIQKELKVKDAYEAEINGVIHIMSAIYTYEENLSKLNNSIRIYRKRYNIIDGSKEEPDIAPH